MAIQLPLLLASASPRRREILRTLGLSFDVASVDADETALPGEAPGAYLERVVRAKLELARPLAAARGCSAVLVADTTVVLDGAMLAKPSGWAENARMVAALSGRKHQVMTRFLVEVPGESAGESAGGPSRAETVTTEVRFRPLSAEEIEGYALSGEGLDKAGGYAIQGLGSFMVEAITGSYSNVVGLPACEVVQALVAVGVLGRFPLPVT